MAFAVVQSGFNVSSTVALFPADRRWAVQVPSMAGTGVRVEFATGSGASDFGALHMRPDLTDVVNSTTVRPAWGTFFPVTAFARVKTAVNVTDTATFTLLPFTAR
jgi:hypothetical protein